MHGFSSLSSGPVHPSPMVHMGGAGSNGLHPGAAPGLHPGAAPGLHPGAAPGLTANGSTAVNTVLSATGSRTAALLPTSGQSWSVSWSETTSGQSWSETTGQSVNLGTTGQTGVCWVKWKKLVGPRTGWS